MTPCIKFIKQRDATENGHMVAGSVTQRQSSRHEENPLIVKRLIGQDDFAVPVAPWLQSGSTARNMILLPVLARHFDQRSP